MIREDDKFYIPDNIQSMSVEEIHLEKERIYKEILKNKELEVQKDD